VRPHSGRSPLTSHAKASLARAKSNLSNGSPGPSAASGGLTRASTGLLGMAYSSQFDVDGQVERVASFLEKDVDFSAWVRDLDEAEENGEGERLTSTQAYERG